MRNFRVGSFNHTEIIYSRVRRETKNKTDVWTFGGMNGTKPTVMRWMHIPHFKAGAFSGKTSWSKRRESPQVLKFAQNIFLKHELRKLVRGKKFPNSGLQRFRGYKLNRNRYLGINRGHTILNVPLNLRHTNANFLLEQFAHKTNATRTEVVNIILHCADSII